MAKIHIIFCFSGLILLTSVNTIIAQKKGKKEEYLNGKSLFFGAPYFGLSLSQVDGDNFAGYHKVNLNFSAVGYTKIDNTIALGTEIGYNTKGSKASENQLHILDNNGNKITAYDITLSYAEVAFTGNVFDKKQNNAGLGIAYSYLLNSKEETNFGEITENPFEKSTLDWLINGNLRLTSSANLFLNFRFQMSILPVRKDYTGIFGRDQQINRQILLRIGYLF